MPPLRTMSSIKPIKTERTHEENQERAYIAASRRSDRSLEARVESARRASEIHKRRTGRALRVTEQDVINEEMYEEEDEGLPRQLHRLTAHLQTGDAAFNYRLNAMVAQQVAFRQALSGNGFAGFNMGPGSMYGGQANQFMDPNMMQMQQPGFHQQYPQQQMPPPQAFNRSPMNYRQAPYPTANYMQGMRSAQFHNRSASLATPQEYMQKQQPQSSQATSPVDNVKAEDRRMSLPAQNAMPQTPHSQHANGQSPTMSRHGSSSNLSTPHAYYKQEHSPQQATPHAYFKQEQSPQQTTPPQYQQPQPQRPHAFAFNQHHSPTDNFSPLSMTLPMNAAQILGDGPAVQDPALSMMMPQQLQQAYKYNPNGKPRSKQSPTQQQGAGLQSTLGMGPTLDTNFNAFDSNGFMTSPESAGTDNLFTPSSNFGFDSGFDDNMFGLDPLKFSSGTTSGDQTPYDSGLFDFDSFNTDAPFADQAAPA